MLPALTLALAGCSLTGVSLTSVVPDAAAAEEAAYQFKVKLQSSDPLPRCSLPRFRCRDDLALPQVIEALNKMASDPASSPFGKTRQGLSGVEVELGEGTYRLSHEWVIRRWPAAGRFGSLTIKGAGSGKTSLSGAVPIAYASWAPPPSGETRLGAAARDHVRVFDTTSLPATVRPGRGARRASGFAEPEMILPLELMVAGSAMPLARWPNAAWATIDRAPDPGRNSFGIAGSGGRSWTNEPDLFVAGYLFHDWAFERLPAQGAGPGSVGVQGPPPKFGVRAGQRVRVENALSELDAPGEWFFDRARNLLYFWPLRAGAFDAELALTPTLLAIMQSEGVTVQDLSLEAATGDAVRIEQSRAVVLQDMNIVNIGNRGVVVEGGTAVKLRRLAMRDLGEGGVLLSGGDRSTLTPSGHTLEDCRIERFARLARSYRPAVVVYGVGAQVLRNRISDGPHAAIVFGGNDHRFEGNHISDVVTETNDAGAIYTGRDWTARGTVITNNLIQNVYPRLPGTSSVMGIYLDDQASGSSITGNVFANVSKAVLIGGGRDNEVIGNVFVRSSPAILADHRGTTWQRQLTQDPGGTLRISFRNWVASAGPLVKRYPHLAEILEDEPGRIKYNTARGNLFVDSREFEFLDGAETGITRSSNRSGNWSVFKRLHAPKAQYVPEDFELTEAATAAGGPLPDLRKIAR